MNEFCSRLTTPRRIISIANYLASSIAHYPRPRFHRVGNVPRTRQPVWWHSTRIPINNPSMAIGQRITAPYAGLFDPTRFVTSWILPPAALFAIRALLAIYAFTTLFFIFGWNGTHGRSDASQQSFSFFTVLTYWGLAFYYAFAAVHTGSYWFTGTSFLARWPKALQVAHSMFYSTIVVYPWIVTSKSTYIKRFAKVAPEYLEAISCSLQHHFWRTGSIYCLSTLN